MNLPIVDPAKSAAFNWGGTPPIIVVAQLRTPLATASRVCSFPTWQHECHIAKFNSFMSGWVDVLGGLTADPAPPAAAPCRMATRRCIWLQKTTRWRWWRRWWHAAPIYMPITRCASCLTGSHPPRELSHSASASCLVRCHLKRCSIGKLESLQAASVAKPCSWNSNRVLSVFWFFLQIK